MTSIIFQRRDNKLVASDFDVVTEKNIDNLKLQLEWIQRLQDQIDFANKEVLPDFKLFFKAVLRRPPV